MIGTTMSHTEKSRRAGRFLCLLCYLLLVSGLGLLLYARSNREWAESYALGFYPKWCRLLSTVTSPIPFSLAEGILVLLVLSLGFLVVRLIVRMIREKKRSLRLLGGFLLRLGAFASLVFFLFVIGSGIQYERYLFSDYSGLTVTESSVEELVGLCRMLSTQTNYLREQVQEDENGVFILSGLDTAPETARENFSLLIAQRGSEWEKILAPAAEVLPKKVFFSELMSYAQLDGFFFPFTMEANVNIHTSDMDIPFTMCHELSHISGFMREDEANYIAYLVCMISENADFRYSGSANALMRATNALYGKDRTLYAEVISELSPAVLRDFSDDAAYYNAHSSSFGKFSSAVNDTYLKANNQNDGLDSYGRMVDLLLAEYRLEQQIKE